MKDKAPLLCRLRLHSWVGMRDPKGVKPMHVPRLAPGGLYVEQIYNQRCRRCGKLDLKANRMRDAIAANEAATQRAYGEKEEE